MCQEVLHFQFQSALFLLPHIHYFVYQVPYRPDHMLPFLPYFHHVPMLSYLMQLLREFYPKFEFIICQPLKNNINMFANLNHSQLTIKSCQLRNNFYTTFKSIIISGFRLSLKPEQQKNRQTVRNLLKFKIYLAMSESRVAVSSSNSTNSPIELLGSLESSSNRSLTPRLLFPSDSPNLLIPTVQSHPVSQENSQFKTQGETSYENSRSSFTMISNPEQSGYDYACKQFQLLKQNIDKLEDCAGRYKKIYEDSCVVLEESGELSGEFLQELKTNLFQILEAASEDHQFYSRKKD